MCLQSRHARVKKDSCAGGGRTLQCPVTETGCLFMSLHSQSTEAPNSTPCLAPASLHSNMLLHWVMLGRFFDQSHDSTSDIPAYREGLDSRREGSSRIDYAQSSAMQVAINQCSMTCFDTAQGSLELPRLHVLLNNSLLWTRL